MVLVLLLGVVVLVFCCLFLWVSLLWVSGGSCLCGCWFCLFSGGSDSCCGFLVVLDFCWFLLLLISLFWVSAAFGCCSGLSGGSRSCCGFLCCGFLVVLVMQLLLLWFSGVFGCYCYCRGFLDCGFLPVLIIVGFFIVVFWWFWLFLVWVSGGSGCCCFLVVLVVMVLVVVFWWLWLSLWVSSLRCSEDSGWCGSCFGFLVVRLLWLFCAVLVKPCEVMWYSVV